MSHIVAYTFSGDYKETDTEMQQTINNANNIAELCKLCADLMGINTCAAHKNHFHIN